MKTDRLGEVNTTTTAGAGDTQYLSVLFDQDIGMGFNTILVHCEETTGAPTVHTITYEPITNIGSTLLNVETRILTGITAKNLAIYECGDSPSAWDATTAKVPAATECNMCWLETNIPWQGTRFTVVAAAGATATVKLVFYIIYH